MNKKLVFKRVFYIVIILCVATIFYLQFKVISEQNSFSPLKSDAILILGHSLEGEMEQPDKWLIERLNLALNLYNEGYGEKLIVTGGKGHTYKHSVANAMKNWLVENGVAEENILLEESAKNTTQNFIFSKEIAETNGIRSIVVVTNDFHMFRSMQIGEKYIAELSGSSATLSFSLRKLLAYAKEPFSIIKFFVFDRYFQPY